METIAVHFITHQLLPWLLFSGAVYGVMARFTRGQNTSPRIWWCSVIATFLLLSPFLLTPFANIAVTAPDIAWINTSIENAHLLKQATLAHAELNDTRYPVALFIAIYVGVVFYKMLMLALNWWRLNALMRQTQLIDVGLNTDFNVVVSPLNHSPFVYGVLKPIIVLPHNALSMSATRLRILVQHELTHITYKDPASVVVWRLLSIVLWINPFIRRMEWQFIRAMEHRCDHQTITRFGLKPFEYAQTLLQSLRSSVVVNTNPVTQFNTAALDSDDYKQRLTHIVQTKHPINFKAILGLCGAIVFLVCVTNYIDSVNGNDAPQWQHPLENYRISSPFRNVSKIRYYKPHQGVDYVAPYGSAVSAAADGVVVIGDAQTLHPNFGNAVIIQHKGGYQTLYAHLAIIDVTPGQWVHAGERIGVIGDTGKTTGVHLHLEVMRHEQRLNPSVVFP